MKAKNIFSALSIKHAGDVLMEIDSLCQTEDYPTFKELSERTGLNRNTLRRITNKLSRVGLIKPTKKNDGDKRQRVYVIRDVKLDEYIFYIICYLECK
jgi:DNA-binding MarR family transcriptional regulator